MKFRPIKSKISSKKIITIFIWDKKEKQVDFTFYKFKFFHYLSFIVTERHCFRQ